MMKPAETDLRADVAVVAGSGLDLAGLLDEVAYDGSLGDLADTPHQTVDGHSGRLLVGRCEGRPLVLQSGRLHFYEGFDYETITRSIEVFARMGVRTVFLTNAAGGLREGMRPGDLLAVTDVRCFVPHPGSGLWAEVPGHIRTGFVVDGCTHRGTLVWVPGPNYETRAEIAALQVIGGSAVGMSVAPELLRCRELGLRGAAISCITNVCCRPERLHHKEVLLQAGAASRNTAKVIRAAIGAIAADCAG